MAETALVALPGPFVLERRRAPTTSRSQGRPVRAVPQGPQRQRRPLTPGRSGACWRENEPQVPWLSSWSGTGKQATGSKSQHWLGGAAQNGCHPSFRRAVGGMELCGRSLVGPITRTTSSGSGPSTSSHQAASRRSRCLDLQATDLAVAQAVVTAGTQSCCLSPRCPSTGPQGASTCALSTAFTVPGARRFAPMCRGINAASSSHDGRPPWVLWHSSFVSALSERCLRV